MNRRIHMTSAVMIIIGLAACSDEASEPGVVSTALLGDQTFPEGIAAHPQTNTLFVGGIASADIQKIQQGRATYFKTSQEDGLVGVVGMAVDAARNRLWVTNTSINDPAIMPELVVFDIDSGRVLGRFSVPQDGAPHLFNDVTVNQRGDAFVTDSLSAEVWTVDSALTEMRVLATADAFNLAPSGISLNGIAVTEDQRYLVVSIADLDGGALFRVRLDDGQVDEIPTPEDFGGFDGIDFLPDGRLLGIGFMPKLQVASFGPDFMTVNFAPVTAFDEQLDFPTTVAALGDRAWIVNSQLDHLLPMTADAHPGPHALPFVVVGVSLTSPAFDEAQ